MLEKTMRLNYLLDFYQSLLTPKQKDYMKMYYFEDLSLVEISNFANVSRQAVYDNVKRTGEILESYEDKLALYDKFEERNKLLTKFEDLIAQDANNDQLNKMIHQLKELG